MKLSIIIPAYNEEKAISQIIQGCLDAKINILKQTDFDSIEIIVVNDGSTDKTPIIANAFKSAGTIILVSHDKNRGYGAAIKSGFKMASGDYLGFLDADGTCDPNYFVNLWRKLKEDNADIVIGSRMGPNSHMPKIRRLGNLFFARLLSAVSDTTVTDSASGMRIIRRESLEDLYPLPDGMSFTPAMSAKASMNVRLKMVEEYIPYKERVGDSKLEVINDGIRFLKAIIEIGLFYKPFKFFMLISLSMFVTAVYFGCPLIFYYLKYRSLLETDIYRITTVITIGVAAFNIMYLGIAMDGFISIFNNTMLLHQRTNNRYIRYLIEPKRLVMVGFIFIMSGLGLNSKTITQYLSSGTINVHWVYVTTGGFLTLIGFQTIIISFIEKLLCMHREAITLKKTN